LYSIPFASSCIELLLLKDSNSGVANSCVVLLLLTAVLVLLLLLTALTCYVGCCLQLYSVALVDSTGVPLVADSSTVAV
jgi:hypothetical protein